jgi:4-hydroxy-tetrahydrodipicolinate synthase
MKKTIFQGAATALITPFRDGHVDYKAFDQIIEHQIVSGIDALVACGTTGESSTLTDLEHREIIAYCVEKVAGRVPVIAGTGSNETSYAMELSRFAAQEGADAVLIVTPYYNKCTPKGLIRHYQTIADSCSIPLILYNGVNIKPETYAVLAEHENIVAIKEASGDIASAATTLSLCQDKIDMYSGNDDEVVPILSIGGKGVISVLSNIAPAQIHEMCQSFFDGNVKKARELQLKYMELIHALFCEVNPIPVKTAMAALGYCTEEMRLPLCEMESATRAKLMKALEILK